MHKVRQFIPRVNRNASRIQLNRQSFSPLFETVNRCLSICIIDRRKVKGIRSLERPTRRTLQPIRAGPRTNDGEIRIDEFKKAIALNNDAFVLSANLNAEYNFLRGRFSPLLRAGLGLYDITDNAGYWTTYGETDFSWNVGGGFRWNATDHLVLKLVGGASWTELKNSSSTAQFGFVTLSIGASF